MQRGAPSVRCPDAHLETPDGLQQAISVDKITATEIWFMKVLDKMFLFYPRLAVVITPVGRTDAYVFVRRLDFIKPSSCRKGRFKPASLKLAGAPWMLPQHLWKAKGAHCYFGNCAFTESSLSTCLGKRLHFFLFLFCISLVLMHESPRIEASLPLTSLPICTLFLSRSAPAFPASGSLRQACVSSFCPSFSAWYIYIFSWFNTDSLKIEIGAVKMIHVSWCSFLLINHCQHEYTVFIAFCLLGCSCKVLSFYFLYSVFFLSFWKA